MAITTTSSLSPAKKHRQFRWRSPILTKILFFFIISLSCLFSPPLITADENLVTSSLQSSTATESSTQNYTLRNLEPFTEYLVTLRVFNPQGDGPTATLAATTDEGGMKWDLKVYILYILIRVSDFISLFSASERVDPTSQQPAGPCPVDRTDTAQWSHSWLPHLRAQRRRQSDRGEEVSEPELWPAYDGVHDSQSQYVVEI